MQQIEYAVGEDDRLAGAPQFTDQTTCFFERHTSLLIVVALVFSALNHFAGLNATFGENVQR